MFFQIFHGKHIAFIVSKMSLKNVKIARLEFSVSVFSAAGSVGGWKKKEN